MSLSEEVEEIVIKGIKDKNERFKKSFPIDTEEVILSEESLVEIDLKPLTKFSNLKKLDFSINKLSNLDYDQIAECITIEDFSINDNNFTSIPKIS